MTTSNPQRPEDLLEPVASEDEDYTSAPPAYEIVTYPADYTLEVLYNMWSTERITIPPFQRGFVWKLPQASRLIESFLVGLPVPAVFLFSEQSTATYMVLDGQQRLRTIFHYFEGFFGTETRGTRPIFRLKGLHPDSPFFDQQFTDLPEDTQRNLQNSVLRAFIVRQLNPEDDTSIYHIFERLNTGGTSLANQEIRDCLYHGPFAEFLERANELSTWRQILGTPLPHNRKKDLELILRFLALQDTSAYTKPMKDFLSRFMKKNSRAPEPVLNDSLTLFSRTCEVIVEALGLKPFHVRSGLNAAVFDAVMHAFSRHIDDAVPKDVRSRYEQLKADADFEVRTRSGTTDVEVLRSRLRQASRVLFSG